MKTKRKTNRVIYRLWHNKSDAGRVGYIGKDKYHPDRFNLVRRRKFDIGCKKLYRALNKYPIKVWHKEILASGFKSDTALNKAEVRWIKKLDSKNKGYNCTDGGEGFIGLKFSDEHKSRISKSHQGIKNPMYGVRGKDHPRYGVRLTVKMKKRISNALKGNKAPNWGKKLSAVTRKKISESKIGDKNPMSSVNRKLREKKINHDS